MPAKDLGKSIAAALRKVAVPEDAEPMRAYMKSEMKYLGVKSPLSKAALKPVYARFDFEDADEWRAAIEAGFMNAKFREVRYGIIKYARLTKCRRFLTIESLPLMRTLIIEGAWWDYVDEIAAHLLGGIVKSDPKKLAPIMRRWAKDDDLWIRRSSILCQLRFKEDTDLELLADCIKPSLSRPEFWLRKAIGWSLRDLGRHRPDWVISYVMKNAAKLSPLSKKEATRNLIKAGLLEAVP